MPVLKLYTNDQRDAREAGVNCLFKKLRGRQRSVILVTPGGDKKVPIPGAIMAQNMKDRMHLKNFSFETLCSLIGEYDEIIIEDAHRLTKGDIENIIAFSREKNCNIHFVGKEYDDNSKPYPVKMYLPDQEQIENLPDYGIEKNISDMVVRANEFQPKSVPSENQPKGKQTVNLAKKRLPSKRASKGDIAKIIAIAAENKAKWKIEAHGAGAMVDTVIENIDTSSERIESQKMALIGYRKIENDLRLKIEKTDKTINALLSQLLSPKRQYS